ncbi:unnamed protein product [Brachionus calyciflorus]|uniref:Uncharacterized protein n=1 Tax=Brachionus calyciflorus TaxID=104777 RepID=A0A813MH33_9BILA|nr:unnamed protein product [Brachionus calyciflorus]
MSSQSSVSWSKNKSSKISQEETNEAKLFKKLDKNDEITEDSLRNYSSKIGRSKSTSDDEAYIEGILNAKDRRQSWQQLNNFNKMSKSTNHSGSIKNKTSSHILVDKACVKLGKKELNTKELELLASKHRDRRGSHVVYLLPKSNIYINKKEAELSDSLASSSNSCSSSDNSPSPILKNKFKKITRSVLNPVYSNKNIGEYLLQIFILFLFIAP